MSKLEITNLNLSFDETTPILQNINLKVDAGQIVSLLGPSGSGKSTLLRALNRLLEPSPQTIFLDSVDITTIDVLDLRRRVGMLFQKPALFEGSVAYNLAYGPMLHGIELSETRLLALLKMAALPEKILHRPALELSGGEAQRVALARALANEPEVLLLDEPSSALDPAATRLVEETILHLRDEFGLTVVWVSHAVEQVVRTADNVILLLNGAVAEEGDPQVLLNSERHHFLKDFVAGEVM